MEVYSVPGLGFLPGFSECVSVASRDIYLHHRPSIIAPGIGVGETLTGLGALSQIFV
jgi:hypothetical protein